MGLVGIRVRHGYAPCEDGGWHVVQQIGDDLRMLEAHYDTEIAARIQSQQMSKRARIALTEFDVLDESSLAEFLEHNDIDRIVGGLPGDD